MALSHGIKFVDTPLGRLLALAVVHRWVTLTLLALMGGVRVSVATGIHHESTLHEGLQVLNIPNSDPNLDGQSLRTSR